MRPIELTLKGINSFREEQTINFIALTSQGLFGIFGPTGSGKSTILDAMTLALYAKLPRSTKNFININETSAYVSFRFSITTTQTEEYLVERSFRYMKNNSANSCRNISGKIMKINGEESVILADRPTEVTQECISLLGLTADDFMRTVVLPQGQFSDFLKLKNTDRRSMLQRIFHLEEYGIELTSKIKRAKQNQDVVIGGLEGEIKSYFSVSNDALEQLNQKSKTLSDTITQKTAELEQMQVVYEQAKEIHLLREELEPLKQQDANLTKQTPAILSYKNRLEAGIKANRLYPFFQQKEAALSHLILARTQLTKAKDLLTKYEETLTSSKKDSEELQKKYTAFSENYHEKRQTLIKAQDVQERIQSLLRKQKAAEESVSNAQVNLQTLKEKQQQNEEIFLKYKQQMDALKEQMKQLHPDPSKRQLLEYGKEQEENYLKNVEYCEKLSRKLAEQEKEKEILTHRLEQLKIQLSSCHRDCLTLCNALQENLTSLQNEYKKTEEDIDLLQKKKEYFAKEHWTNIFRNDLKEGDPCPICGNIHHKVSTKNHQNSHSTVESPEDVPDENTHNYDNSITKLQKNLSTLTEKIQDTKQMISSLNSTISEIEPYLTSAGRFDQAANDSDETTTLDEENSQNACALANTAENSLNPHTVTKERIQNTCASAKQLLNKHLQLSGTIDQQEQQLIASRNEYDEEFKKMEKSHEQFVQFQEKHGFLLSVDLPEPENSPAYSFTKQLNSYYKQEKQYNELSKKYSSLQTEQEKISENAQSFHEEIQSLTSVHTARTAELKQIQSQLEEEYSAYPANLSITLDFQKELYSLENQQQSWQEQKEKSTSQLDLLEKKYADAKEDYSAKLAVEKNCCDQYKSLSATYVKELAKEQLSDQDDLNDLTLSDQEQDNLTKQIKEFETKQIKLKEQISYIESKLSKKDTSQTEEKWLLLNKKYENLSGELKNLENEYILVEHKIKQMKLDLEKKQDIEQNLEKANHKKSIIHELEKLFQGNAFIEYVSLTRLEYIAKEASSTLIQVSNGKYSLEINDQTEFVIRDHHNGGMIRPCDTLSGGETFITSLCLALALSSTLQLNGTTPLELFFLDEGFGSLDDELLDVVMDSLEKLQNRKRSIGIISHVESIQCRVPRKLIVTPAEAEKNGSRVRLEFS